jgi:hypothetical protein
MSAAGDFLGRIVDRLKGATAAHGLAVGLSHGDKRSS